MKATLDRDALVKAMTRTARVVERRNTIPILSNIHMETNEDGLALKATDLDLEIRGGIRCEVGAPGCLTVPAATLLEIARKLPSGAQVALEADEDGKQLTVRSGRSRFKLNALPATDFPDMDAGAMTHEFTLHTADLKKMIEHVAFAISTEETRYYLNGIYLHHAEEGLEGIGSLRGVATDGHRLAQFDLIMPEGAAGMAGVIIPRKTVAEIAKLAEEADAVRVALSSSKIRFTFGETVLTSKLIDGTFPDYRRVIPSGNSNILKVEPEAFAKAVERVISIATERSRAVKLTLAPGAEIGIDTVSPDAGSASETLEGEFDGEALSIGFNGKYLMDIASHITGKTLTMALADAGAPTVIRDGTDSAALYVLMPMRV